MKYSKRSFHFAVFSVIILNVFYIFSHIERNPAWQLDDLVGFLIILLMVCSAMGVLSGFIAITEPSNKRKWVGLAVNASVVVGVILYLSQ
jgi:uncharacterized membrane protein HdeD (DUF308 family)